MGSSKDKDNQAHLDALNKLSQQMDTLIKLQSQIKEILTDSHDKMPPPDYNVMTVKGIKSLDEKVSSYHRENGARKELLHYIGEKLQVQEVCEQAVVQMFECTKDGIL